MMKQYSLLILLFVATFSIRAQPIGYSFGRTITILDAQVTGTTDFTDFPVLISITSDPLLESAANGGNVESDTGNDVVFYSSDCLTKLDHQIESYNPTTGQFIVWVRVPTLYAQANTEIHMYYGKSGESSTSTTAVWDANYLGVWHFSGDVNDATSNGNDLTDNNSENLTGGKIGAGRNLNNNSDVTSNNNGRYLSLSNNFFSGITDFTFSGWVRLDRTNTFWERIFDFGRNNTVNFFFTPSNGNGFPAETRARITVSGNGGEQGTIQTNSNPITGEFIHWAVVVDAVADEMKVYKNGSQYGATATGVNLMPSNLEPTTSNYFGRSHYNPDHYIDGRFDEFRISNSARSADWIQTSYNNQDNPSNFYTITGEVSAASICTPLPVDITYFSAVAESNRVKISWSTESEINNDYFTIERSTDGTRWNEIAIVPGAGTSLEKKIYVDWDNQPVSGTSYYRLKQTDYDGSISYSKVVAITITPDAGLKIYTNATARKLVVEPSDDHHAGEVSILTPLGQPISIPFYRDRGNWIFDTIKIPSGIYIVLVRSYHSMVAEKVSIK